MLIGFDYDGTFTEDPECWLAVIKVLRHHGSVIALVTMRYPSEMATVDPRLLELCDFVIPTSRGAKAPAVIAATGGAMPHVWIDDNPRAILESAEQIWGLSTAEGHVITENLNAT
jgi:hypothetical protein